MVSPENNGNAPNASASGSPSDGSPSGRCGVILLCHGSQRGTSRDECSCSWAAQEGDWPEWCRHCPDTRVGLAEASERLQSVLGEPQADVLLSCLEFIQPHPDQAVEALAERGLEQVVIMPYLLGQGKHATEELEEVLEELREQSPQVQLALTRGLGSDPRLADLVVERVRDLDGTPSLTPGDGRTVGVLLVKAGTRTQYDDCLWLQELGRIAERQLGDGYAVEIAQSHYGDPTMEYASARLVEERGVSAVLCVPYLFFPGMILKRNVLGGMQAAREKYPNVEMHVAPPLGVDDRVVAVAADRVREVWGR